MFLHQLAVFQSHHGLRGQQRTEKASDPPSTHAEAPQAGRDAFTARRTDPRLSVVGGRLIEWLVEFELDFGVFEGALGPHAHCPVVVQAEHQIGLGPIAHLSGREPDTCRIKVMREKVQ